SMAALPQFTPPTLPGTAIVPSTDGGVKILPPCRVAIFDRQPSRSSGVNPQASSGVILCGTRGGKLDIGCVGQVFTPGTLLCGTGRSSTGWSGLPVSRSSAKTLPILVVTTTAGRL